MGRLGGVWRLARLGLSARHLCPRLSVLERRYRGRPLRQYPAPRPHIEPRAADCLKCADARLAPFRAVSGGDADWAYIEELVAARSVRRVRTRHVSRRADER